ncbi:MAG: hypothetical protein EB127_30100, partial [Alphaproteobacteria bacterium]|nr:hypothetical protein [Alphaproteobacteria bacterium]
MKIYEVQMIGIFGGSFDPIHNGHLRAALEVQQRLGLEKIIFIPCQQHAFGKTFHATASQRLHMLQLAIEGQKNFAIDPRELNRSGISYTVDTLIELTTEAPELSYSLILGMDNLLTLEQWHQGPATIYKPIDPLPPSGIYLNGHLQTSKYFYDEDTKNDIRELFRPSSALEEEVKAKYKYLWENKDRVVVVHARRTDYLKNQIMIDTHGPLSSDYYKEAIQRMKEKISDPIWVLTSDDNRFWIEIENDLGIHAPIIMMNESDIHSFVLLQQFNHYIMSNSTFIWWCVWMADAKHVIAPSKWFGPLGPYPYEDIYELHWI